MSNPIYDIIIVGAGFPGIYLLHHLRKLRYNYRIYESGTDLARVDSEGWIYQKYHSTGAIRKYFAHMDKLLDIKKDVEFPTTVTGAQFDKDGSNMWKGGVDVRGKKVAVTLAKEVGSMTVFQRTPNLAVPMQQRPLSAEEQGEIKSKLSFIFKARTQNYGGYLDESNPAKTFDVPAEEREPFYESLLQRGGFAFLLGGYSDLLIDGAANHEAYKYWAKKTRARITDPRKRDILAPLKQYHPIGAKRCSMETDYFEQYNCDNVDVVGLRSPGTPSQFYTGSFTLISNLRNTDRITLEEWARGGATSYLGMTRKGYPTFSSRTACTMVNAVQKVDTQELKYIEPKLRAEQAWKAQINAIVDMTLSEQVCWNALENWEGFDTV
ncbi:hypothetical protein BDV06DRAFT_212500 [Aspergillus oleicola]